MAKKETIEEQLEKFKLYSKYNSSETLSENVEQIFEQSPAASVTGFNTYAPIFSQQTLANANKQASPTLPVAPLPQGVTPEAYQKIMATSIQNKQTYRGAYLFPFQQQEIDKQFGAGTYKKFWDNGGRDVLDGKKEFAVTAPNPQTPAVVNPSISQAQKQNSAKTAPTVAIPQELKDAEGVKKFQTWLDANKPGWHQKYSVLGNSVPKGWGKFGPNTQKAWNNEEIRNSFLNQGRKEVNPTTQPVQQVTNIGSEKPNLTAPQKVPANLKGVSTQPQTTPEQYYNQLVSGGFIDSIAQGGNRIVYRGPKIDDNVENYVNQYLSTQGYTKVRERDPQNRDKEVTVWKK